MSFDIEPEGEQVKLTVIHDDFEPGQHGAGSDLGRLAMEALEPQDRARTIMSARRGMPDVVDRAAFQAELDALRVREKAHTREGDAIAAARRRLPMVEVDGTTPLVGAERSRHAARRVRGPPPTDRLLLHVVHRPSGCRAVRGLHVVHHPRRGAVVSAFPRYHVRGLLPGALRREPPLPRLHGLGHAVVLGAGLPGHAARRARRSG